MFTTQKGKYSTVNYAKTFLTVVLVIFATRVKKRKAQSVKRKLKFVLFWLLVVRLPRFLVVCATVRVSWSWLLVVGLSVYSVLLSALPIQPRHATVLPTTTTVWLLTGWSICRLVPAPVPANSTSSAAKLCSVTDASFTGEVGWTWPCTYRVY